MDSFDGCLLVVVSAFLVAAALFVAVDEGRDRAHAEFRECRALLATDSAAVLRYRSECRKWTLPPREAR